MLRNASLARRFFLPTLGLFIFSMGGLFGVVHWLYVSSFNTTLESIHHATTNLKRQAAEDLLREVTLATESSLQRGEYEQFVLFAEQQNALEEIEEFSFITPDGTVQLSSHPENVGQPLNPEIWHQVQTAQKVIINEYPDSFTFTLPLRADADMRRLNPDRQVGQLYGGLHLSFSKTKINDMMTTARDTFHQNTSRAVLIAAAGVVAALALSSFVLLTIVVRPAVRALKHMIDTLISRTTDLVGVARQIASSSDKAAQSTTQQASSLEQTAAALEELSGTSKTNAGHARDANNLAEEATQAANQGNHIVEQLRASMAANNNSTEKIGSIIKVIEGIAFQTNLLALNAAVEAARAGELGKSFGVVAGEVGSLASRVAQAAQESSTLITETVHHAREGNRVSENVAQSLDNIGQRVTRVSSLLDTIAVASDQQARGVEQINSAVGHMDKITQQNAAGAQESAAAAQELEGHTQAMNRLVSDLVTLVEGK